MNWRVKIFSKIIISRLPIKYGFWKKIGIFRHGSMDNIEYSISVFQSHLKNSNIKSDLNGKVILELGPGDSISTAVIAAAYGAKAILVDVGHFVQQDISVYFKLESVLQAKGLNPPDLSKCVNLQEVLKTCNASYMTNGLSSLKTLENDSVNFIFSQAVLEHVRKKDFLEVMENCRRILIGECKCSHRVDLRDHLGGGLQNLRFSESLWESDFFVNSGFYTNRIRFYQMERLFKNAGFKPLYTKIDKWENVPLSKNKMLSCFGELSDEELSIYGFNVILN
jgi:hypothetical protein